jgi:hypothetical protein
VYSGARLCEAVGQVAKWKVSCSFASGLSYGRRTLINYWSVHLIKTWFQTMTKHKQKMKKIRIALLSLDRLTAFIQQQSFNCIISRCYWYLPSAQISILDNDQTDTREERIEVCFLLFQLCVFLADGILLLVGPLDIFHPRKTGFLSDGQTERKRRRKYN